MRIIDLLLNRPQPDSLTREPALHALPRNNIIPFSYRYDQVIDPQTLYSILGYPANGSRLTLLYRVAISPGEYVFGGHNVRIVGSLPVLEAITSLAAEQIWPDSSPCSVHRRE